MFATFYWGQTYERQAQLREAYEIYQRGLAFAEKQMNGRTPSSAVGFMHIALGRLLYEWNRLGEAESHIRRALACAERSGDHKMLIYSREALAQLLTTLGDHQAAQGVVNDLEQQTQSLGTSKLRAMLALQCGDLTTAQQWATNLEIALTDPDERICEWPSTYLTLAHLHLVKREFEGVLAVLETLAAHGEARQSTQFLIHATCLQALAYGKQGDVTTAVTHCQRALSLAEPGGYIRLFLDHQDATLARLLHQVAASGGVTAAYAHKLLTHLNPEAIDDTSDIEPLSSRELEVLQHLAAGLTNRQIAEQMVVTINTVKAHTRRLYAKLDVSNRTQAVARARQLHLL
jgi:LuxR family maltose regulon positive regulatory protein